MKPLIREGLAQQLEAMDALDAIGEPLQRAVHKLVPSGSRRKDLLSGTWLGHPVHPMLTDIVIGAWTSSWFLDWGGGEEAESASERLIGIGILAAVPTAAAGLSDWADLARGPRRVGTLHALGNVTGLTLYSLSWVARKGGNRRMGRFLGLVASGVATASAYLGGHLSFGKGVGVNQTAFQDFPVSWTPALDEAQLVDGKPAIGMAGDNQVVVVREGSTLYALANRCSHRGCGLHGGRVIDGALIECQCHGSRFRLADGGVVRGPATSPQPRLEVRIRKGKVEIRRPSESGLQEVSAAS